MNAERSSKLWRYEICKCCGTKTVFEERKVAFAGKIETITERRDFYPVSYLIKLKPETRTTFIIGPETERIVRGFPFHRIRSLDSGKNSYAIDVSLPEHGGIERALLRDERIAEWGTAAGPACERHVYFKEARW